MKLSQLILIAAIVLAGCKASDSKDNKDIVEGIGNYTVPKERNFTDSEKIIGKRICSALKNKRLLFERINDMQEKFRLKNETKSCAIPAQVKSGEFNVSISNSNSTDFAYDAGNYSNPYLKDVLTDQNGAMKLLCDNLDKNLQNVSNTMLSGSSYLVVNLLIADGYDRFEVSKRTKNATTGEYAVASIESVDVITQTSQAAAKFFGVEKERTKYTICPGNAQNFLAVRQTWLSAITTF